MKLRLHLATMNRRTSLLTLGMLVVFAGGLNRFGAASDVESVATVTQTSDKSQFNLHRPAIAELQPAFPIPYAWRIGSPFAFDDPPPGRIFVDVVVTNGSSDLLLDGVDIVSEPPKPGSSGFWSLKQTKPDAIGHDGDVWGDDEKMGWPLLIDDWNSRCREIDRSLEKCASGECEPPEYYIWHFSLGVNY